MQDENYSKVKLDLIDPDPNQPRQNFDQDALQGLADSMREIGQLQPIRVRRVGDRFIIVDGERRWRAAAIAGLSDLAVVIDNSEPTAGKVTLQQFVANSQREDLNPADRALAIAAIKEQTGWTHVQIAKTVGISITQVSRFLDVASLPPHILDQMRTDKIGLSAGSQLAHITDPVEQAKFASEMALGLTRDELKGRISAAKKQAESSTGDGPSRITARLGADTAVTVVAKGLSMASFIEVLEDVISRARRARTQGLEVKTFAKMLVDQSKPGGKAEPA